MPLSKHFRFCLWWESFFNGGHFSTCQTRKKSTPVTFFLHIRHVFLRPGVISLRRKMTPRSIFDGGRYSSLHRPMACLSLNLYDTPGLAPRMNVLFWGPGDFPVSYSNRDTLWNAWNRHSRSFTVDTGILLSNMECFILRAMRLSNKLLGQGYVKERLKSSLRKFYGRYWDLPKQYEVPLSRMLHDILDDDHIQWHPPLIGITPILTITDLDLITEFDFLPNCARFP